MNSLFFAATHRKAVALVRSFAAFSLVTVFWMSPVTVQARDSIQWSIGVHSPGVSIGTSNAPGAVFSYPSYGYPVYESRPVVVYPRPVVVHPQPVVIYENHPGYGRRYGKEHGYERYDYKYGDKHYRSYRDDDDDDDDD